MRLEPFLSQNKPIYLLAADRSGKERQISFHGCSCAVKVCNKPKLIKHLGKNDENTLFVKIKI
jgi:hypothetical protein